MTKLLRMVPLLLAAAVVPTPPAAQLFTPTFMAPRGWRTRAACPGPGGARDEARGPAPAHAGERRPAHALRAGAGGGGRAAGRDRHHRPRHGGRGGRGARGGAGKAAAGDSRGGAELAPGRGGGPRAGVL